MSHMDDRNTVLLICEKYFLRFYAPLAARLARAGFQPLWIAVNGSDRWDYDWIDPSVAIDSLAEIPICRGGRTSTSAVASSASCLNSPICSGATTHTPWT